MRSPTGSGGASPNKATRYTKSHAALLLDHDARIHELIARTFDGQSSGLARDDILDNITLYWLTNTAISLAHIYRENTYGFFPRNG